MRRGKPVGRAPLDVAHRLQPEELQTDHEESQPSSSAWVAGDCDGLGTASTRTDDLDALLRSLERDQRVFESDAERAAAESLARRADDFSMRNQLALASFAGPLYDVFVGELITYGFPILMLWMRSGQIFPLCAARGRPVGPSDMERRALQDSWDDRAEVAYETLAEGIKLFRRYALVKGRWTMEGGATLKTYFVGGLIQCFPNVFRRWSKDQNEWACLTRYQRPVDLDEVPRPGLDERPGEDPADVVVQNETLREYLDKLSPEQRLLVDLVMDGHSHAAIGEVLQITERAVEGRLYRLRQSLSASKRHEGRRQ